MSGHSNFGFDELQLWQDFLNNKPGSLEAIYKSFAPALFRYGFHFSQDHAVTEDCIQEVFSTLFQKRSRLSQTTSVKFYLFKCLRLEIIRRLKRDAKSLHTHYVHNPVFDGDFSTESQIIDDEITMIRVKEIGIAINQLPKRQKEAVYLRFYEGLSYAQIAEIMETEQSSAYKIIYKAIASLYEKLATHSGKLFYCLFIAIAVFLFRLIP